MHYTTEPRMMNKIDNTTAFSNGGTPTPARTMIRALVSHYIIICFEDCSSSCE